MKWPAADSCPASPVFFTFLRPCLRSLRSPRRDLGKILPHRRLVGLAGLIVGVWVHAGLSSRLVSSRRPLAIAPRPGSPSDFFSSLWPLLGWLHAVSALVGRDWQFSDMLRSMHLVALADALLWSFDALVALVALVFVSTPCSGHPTLPPRWERCSVRTCSGPSLRR